MTRLPLVLLVISAFPTAEGGSVPLLNFDHANPAAGQVFDRGDVYSSYRSTTHGYTFRVLEPVEITGLGVYDDFGDGIAGSYRVGLWGPQGLVTSGTVAGGQSAELLGSWRHVGVDNVTIPAGDYTVGFAPTRNIEWAQQRESCVRTSLCELFGIPELPPAEMEQYYWLLGPQSVGDNLEGTVNDPRAALQVGDSIKGYSFLASPVYSNALGFALPENRLLVTAAFAGATVFVVPIPEPSSLLLATCILSAACCLKTRATRHRTSRYFQ